MKEGNCCEKVLKKKNGEEKQGKEKRTKRGGKKAHSTAVSGSFCTKHVTVVQKKKKNFFFLRTDLPVAMQGNQDHVKAGEQLSSANAHETGKKNRKEKKREKATAEALLCFRRHFAFLRFSTPLTTLQH